MKGDPNKSIEFSSPRRLTNELTAIQPATRLHYRVLDNWGGGGLKKLAAYERHESIEKWSTPTSCPNASCFLEALPNFQAQVTKLRGGGVKSEEVPQSRLRARTRSDPRCSRTRQNIRAVSRITPRPRFSRISQERGRACRFFLETHVSR